MLRTYRQRPPKRGRLRRDTEIAHKGALIYAATRLYLDGYDLAGIEKVAAEAGVST
jgi:AcrR family transcriptional regulator